MEDVDFEGHYKQITEPEPKKPENKAEVVLGFVLGLFFMLGWLVCCTQPWLVR